VGALAILGRASRAITRERERRISALLNEIDDLREANAALRNVMAQAEQTTLAKSEFLANVSHEIRTPLTAILGFAELLMEEGDARQAPAPRLEALGTIQRNGAHLLSLINDMLDLSKIESGRLALENVTFSPCDVVGEVVALMRVRADAKGLPLRAGYRTRVPRRIDGDPTRLRQILINLVGNAIKFTEVGEVRLDVELCQTGGEARLVFEVVDGGIGMSPEQIARLFRPFAQADASTTRRFGGTGLGLSICKRLADLMNATIEVWSRVGAGSTFRLSLPLPAVVEAELVDGPSHVAPVARTESTPAQRFSGRVLLAEDGPDNQRLIRSLLSRAGVDVVVVDNGAKAIEQVHAGEAAGEPFDLVLMDMQMPLLDGYGATRALRAAGSRVPIVALTAHAMAGERERCVAAGCDEFATKPIDRSRLFDTLARFLGEPPKPPA
jgi:signal transduction histidine kinase/ActR/RegA family two-component response regulator